ncbi:hypothetical protein SELMODRAFT_439864 [Selaginella moellendorffii]|uniref:Major facilitator superfamily (MFS) profile domain-containing protein n=1 Tax=Selaginella moellendorffii TaxID=88036 RepID=D8R7V4_SELML|nr:hypothetical protein SELMODRAFT_439864 [Selaginella moellendorffii]
MGCTAYVAVACLLAALGGLMFGYDVGISSGVTSMDDFLGKFFPSILQKKLRLVGKEGNYCKFDDQGLQAFTLSLYLAGLVATFAASYMTQRFGRKPAMVIAGLFFIAGVVFNAAAENLAMLIIGRILLGCGVGFVPLYLSEIAPSRYWGGLNILFHDDRHPHRQPHRQAPPLELAALTRPGWDPRGAAHGRKPRLCSGMRTRLTTHLSLSYVAAPMATAFGRCLIAALVPSVATTAPCDGLGQSPRPQPGPPLAKELANQQLVLGAGLGDAMPLQLGAGRWALG